MTVPHAKVIVNPMAGGNSTGRKWPEISRLLRHAGLSFDYVCSEGAGHAAELAEEAVNSGRRYVVAVGGDGTINEVANGILRSSRSSETMLGVISTGTGCDFVRSLGIPRHYSHACSSLTGSQSLLIDVGVVEYQSKGQTMQRFFVNAAGIGFDAAVVEATERMPKHFGGTVPYLIGLPQALIGYKNKSVVLRIRERDESARVLSVVVANGSYFGGGMHVAPEASMNDSLLDVVTIGDIDKFDLLKSLPMVYKGTLGNHPKVTMEKVARITVESSEQVLVHADGELLGEGPASFWLIPAALRIVA